MIQREFDTPAPPKKPPKWNNLSTLNNTCEFDYNKITKMFINLEATTCRTMYVIYR